MNKIKIYQKLMNIYEVYDSLLDFLGNIPEINSKTLNDIKSHFGHIDIIRTDEATLKAFNEEDDKINITVEYSKSLSKNQKTIADYELMVILDRLMSPEYIVYTLRGYLDDENLLKEIFMSVMPIVLDIYDLVEGEYVESKLDEQSRLFAAAGAIKHINSALKKLREYGKKEFGINVDFAQRLLVNFNDRVLSIRNYDKNIEYFLYPKYEDEMELKGVSLNLETITSDKDGDNMMYFLKEIQGILIDTFSNLMTIDIESLKLAKIRLSKAFSNCESEELDYFIN